MRSKALLVPVCAALLSGCVSSKVDRDGTIQTPAEANRAGLGGAVSAPLRDINVLRTKIPAALLTAVAEPYARPADLGCGDRTVLGHGGQHALARALLVRSDKHHTIVT